MIEFHLDHVAERHFLGACLSFDGVAMSANLSDDDFSLLGHRVVWRAIQRLLDKGAELTHLGVCAELETAETDVEYRVGADALVDCWPTGKHDSDLWLERILEAACARKAMAMVSELSTKSADMPSEDLMGALDHIRDAVGAKAAKHDYRQASTIVAERLRAIDGDGDAKSQRMPTGIDALDLKIKGMPRGKLSVIAGRPGEGKTALSINLLVRAAKAGVPCMYVSNEDTDGPLASALLSQQCRVDRGDVSAGVFDNPEDALAVKVRGRDVMTWAHRITVSYVHGLGADRIARRIRAAVRRYDVQFVVLDYAQNIPSPDRGLPRTYAIEQNLAVLDELAATENLVFVVGCQLGRGVDGTPAMRDLKDSGSFEQKGKLILAMSSTDEQKTEDRATCSVLKNSEGVGTGDIELMFERRFALIG